MNIEEELIDAIRFHEKERINQLLNDKQLNINYVKDNKSILMYAIEEGEISVVKQILELGANVNFKPDSGYSTLQVAIRSGRFDLVKLLDTFGVDVDANCPYEGSYLNCAARAGELEIVKWLIEEKGKNVNAKAEQFYPLDCALEKGHPEIILYLRNKTPRYNSHAELTAEYCTAIFRLLWGHKIDVNAIFEHYKDQYSMLTMAVKSRHWKIAKLVYEKGGKHLAPINYLNNSFLLYFAVLSGCSKTVNWVLSIPEFRKDINRFTSETGISPLGCAAYNGFNSIIKPLLKKGALINLKNSEGNAPKDPLAHAYDQPRLHTVQLLLDLGANHRLIHPLWIQENYKKDWQEAYLFTITLIKPKLIRFFAALIDVEYFSKTNDIFRKEKPRLLTNLIERAAHHTKHLILSKYQALIKEGLLNIIQTNHKDMYEPSVEKERLQKWEADKLKESLKHVEEILSRHVINRLEEILVQAPYYIMEPYLNYLFYGKFDSIATRRDLNKNLCSGGMQSTSFWKKVNQFLPENFSIFSLFEDLNDKDNAEYAEYFAAETSKSEIVKLKKEVKEFKELKETKEVREIKESKETSEKESNSSKTNNKGAPAHLIKYAEILNQKRYDLAKSIAQKYENALKKQQQPEKVDPTTVIVKSIMEKSVIQKTSLDLAPSSSVVVDIAASPSDRRIDDIQISIMFLFRQMDALSEDERRIAMQKLFEQGIKRSSETMLISLAKSCLNKAEPLLLLNSTTEPSSTAPSSKSHVSKPNS